MLIIQDIQWLTMHIFFYAKKHAAALLNMSSKQVKMRMSFGQHAV